MNMSFEKKATVIREHIKSNRPGRKSVGGNDRKASAGKAEKYPHTLSSRVWRGLQATASMITLAKAISIPPVVGTAVFGAAALLNGLEITNIAIGLGAGAMMIANIGSAIYLAKRAEREKFFAALDATLSYDHGLDHPAIVFLFAESLLEEIRNGGKTIDKNFDLSPHLEEIFVIYANPEFQNYFGFGGETDGLSLLEVRDRMRDKFPAPKGEDPDKFWKMLQKKFNQHIVRALRDDRNLRLPVLIDPENRERGLAERVLRYNVDTVPHVGKLLRIYTMRRSIKSELSGAEVNRKLNEVNGKLANLFEIVGSLRSNGRPSNPNDRYYPHSGSSYPAENPNERYRGSRSNDRS